jgi:enolase
MARIKDIQSREILDSRGNPTVEVTVFLDDGTISVASCPNGASVASHEAVEIRDHDKKRYNGLGVKTAVENIRSILAPQLLGANSSPQQEIDKKIQEIDGTTNMSHVGANATLPLSVAIAKASAASYHLPLFAYLREITGRQGAFSLPTPLFNLVNGGMHAHNTLDFQEFLVIPASSKSYSESLVMGVALYRTLHDMLIEKSFSTLVGDEGGFGPNLETDAAVFSLLRLAVETLGLKIGYDVFFGMDAASNSFYSEKYYSIKNKGLRLTSDELIDMYMDLNNQFHLLYLEDPMAEMDIEGWEKISKRFSTSTILVGDDLTSTNLFLLQTALSKKLITGVVIKPNQIGTVTQALAVAEVAKAAGLKVIVSHRSGETNDDFIVDFAVAVAADYVKFGAPARGERVAKYNRLLHLEEEFKAAKYL